MNIRRKPADHSISPLKSYHFFQALRLRFVPKIKEIPVSKEHEINNVKQ